MQEQIENLRNGKTANPAKEEGLSHKIQIQIFIAYLYFFLDWLPVLRKLSLIFHRDNFCVSSIPH